MPEPISACTVPMSYYEETPEESAPAPKTQRQVACQAAYAECEEAAQNKAAAASLACGSFAIGVTLLGPAGPLGAAAVFVTCEAGNLLNFEADQAMCRSNYYRCDTGS